MILKDIKILILLLILFVPGMMRADHITVQGEVSGLWNADTVMVMGDISVPDGEALMIAPGTVIKFQGDFHFAVNGAVEAIGEPGSMIVFTPNDTTGFSNDTIPGGGWGGIRFDHNRLSNGVSEFYHCRFSYAKKVSADPATGHGGAFYIKAWDKVNFHGCVFENNFSTYNGGAVYLDSSDVSIQHCTFTGNRCGPASAPWGYGGAVCSDNSVPDIRWNIFNGNSSTGVGGALAVRFTDCNVYSNIFDGNVSALGGAFGFLHIPECVNRINNNLIVNNQAAFFGGGVANLNASPYYINNTIIYNSSTYGGGYYCKDSVSPDFYNTVIWGNTAAVGSQGYLFEVYSQADFFYCNVEDGPGMFGGSGGGEAFFGAFESCLDTLPGFAGEGDYPYSLNPSSPMIDAGAADTAGFLLPETDLAGVTRVYNNRIDIGAYEYLPVSVPTPDIDIVTDIATVFPNPFRDEVNVKIDLIEGKKVFIEVFDMAGRRLFHSEEYCRKGNNQFVLHLPDTPDGLLTLRLISGNGLYFFKLYRISHR